MRSLTLLVLLLASTVVHAATQPNLLFVLTDDQALWTLGCYGNREAVTPRLDQLAQQGAKFTNAFVTTPVCSPSRVAFLTGRHGIEVGITDWIAGSEKSVGLPKGIVTWPGLLQKAGYSTALIGKWHLGALPHQHPTNNGFDHFMGHIGGGWSPKNPTLEVEGTATKLDGFSVNLCTDEAIRWMRTVQDKPFALCVHYREPHSPYTPMPPQDMAKLKELDPTVPQERGLDIDKVKKSTKDYYAAITAIDRNVGRMLDELDALKLTDNTIVIFTSDHGYNIGHHTIQHKGNGHWIAGGLRGPKRPNMWDTSLRIPLIIRWPGVTQPGQVIHNIVTNMDTFLSVTDMLNVAVPADAKPHGRSYTPLLRGESADDWPTTFYGAYDLHNGGLAYMRMIRTPEWKLIRHYHANGLDELYDLQMDPGETRNLYGQRKHAKMRQELQTKLNAWRRSVNDPLDAK